MGAKAGSAHSRYAGLLPIEPSDDFLYAIDLKPQPVDLRPEGVPFPNREPSARKRLRGRGGFLIAFCTGVATTLLWQSYGDAAREMIADLYHQLAPRPALTAENSDAPPGAPSTGQLDLGVGQNVDPNAIADREPTNGSADQLAAGQEPTARGTGQTVATEATSNPVESRADASLQPTEHFDTKPTEARPSQTLSERGKHLAAATRHDASCFPSASAVLHNHPGGWATWTLRAPGHEGTLCWYAAARPRGSDHRPRATDHRREMMSGKEIVGITESGLSVPPARADSWAGELP
jgi:hypothetical protein